MYEELEKDIYMKQDLHLDYICKIKKALMSSSKLHMHVIEKFYNTYNLIASLFVKKQDNLHIIILIHVEDVIIIGNEVKVEQL